MAVQQRCRSCGTWLTEQARKCHRCKTKTLEPQLMVWKVDRVDGLGNRYREIIGGYEQALLVDLAVYMAKIDGEPFESEKRPETITLSALAAEYLADPKICEHRDYATRRTCLRIAVRKIGENRTIRALKAAELRAYQRMREADGVSNSGINRELTYLSSMLNWHVDRGRFRSNPIKDAGVKSLPENPARKRIATRAEVEAVCGFMPEQYRPLVKLLAALPLRSHEAVGLRWNDDEVAPWFDVMNAGRGFLVIPAGISKSGRHRDIPIYYSELRDQLADLPSRFTQGRLFMNPDGSSIKLKQMNREWRRARAKAGCNDLRMHDLRHTAITWLLLYGVPPHDVAYISDHASAGIQERYANIEREHMRTVRDRWYNPASGLIEAKGMGQASSVAL